MVDGGNGNGSPMCTWLVVVCKGRELVEIRTVALRNIFPRNNDRRVTFPPWKKVCMVEDNR